MSALGWDAGETAYGRRARVGDDGKLSGGCVPRDHRLYLSGTIVDRMRGVVRASVPRGR